jgi:hypothetical protein
MVVFATSRPHARMIARTRWFVMKESAHFHVEQIYQVFVACLLHVRVAWLCRISSGIVREVRRFAGSAKLLAAAASHAVFRGEYEPEGIGEHDSGENESFGRYWGPVRLLRSKCQEASRVTRERGARSGNFGGGDREGARGEIVRESRVGTDRRPDGSSERANEEPAHREEVGRWRPWRTQRERGRCGGWRRSCS